MKKRLSRPKRNRYFLGLCAGIADYFNINPTIVRLIFVFSGIGALTYYFASLFIPENPLK